MAGYFIAFLKGGIVMSTPEIYVSYENLGRFKTNQDTANEAKFYTKTQTYTKAEVDSAISGEIGKVYKPKGSVAFASLPAASAATLGEVYNVTDEFTTTASYVEGAGKTHPAGTNVGIVELTAEVPESTEGAGDGTPATYGYDVFAGMIDLSPYAKTADYTPATDAQIDALFS
jgi:hypothetical protein